MQRFFGAWYLSITLRAFGSPEATTSVNRNEFLGESDYVLTA